MADVRRPQVVSQTRLLTPSRAWARVGFHLAVVVGALSCSGGKDSTPPATRVASSLVVAGGDAQHAVVGTELPSALVVRVVDKDGQPVPGQSVSFVVVRGGGHVFAGASISNAEGMVQERWTLGTVATDSQVVEARAVDNSTGAAMLFATFHATATPDAPVAINAITGDAQQGTLGMALPVPVVAQVVDKYGNGVPGQSMAFTVRAGGGSATPATAMTDSTGRGATAWTLGGRLDTVHVLTATSGTLPAARFTATPMLPATATLTRVAGDNQDGVVAAQLATPVKVLVALPNGQPVTGARVLWDATGNNGSTADPVSVTGADGTAQTAWTLGHVAGADTMSATVLGVASTTFHATARADAATTLEVRSGDAQSALPGASVPVAMVVRALDQYGNPTAGEAVDWSTDIGSITPGAGSTGANGEVSATLTLPSTAGTAHVTAALARNSAVRASFTARAMQVQIAIQPGLPSSGTVGTLLAQPVVAKVTADGAPLAGVSVTFASVSGGGSLTPSPVVTDAAGLASTRWVLGTVAGRDSASAAVQNAPATGIGITAVAGPAAHVTAVSGSGQTATVGETLAQPLVARATDQYGNLVSSVDWSSDGGTVTPIAADADGNVRATWTVARSGTVNAMAVAGVDTAAFSATVAPAPGTSLSLSSAPSGSLVVARGMSVSVILRDANGAAMSGAPVTWKITAGNGSFDDIQIGTVFVDTATTMTNASGAASLNWFLGRTVGQNTLVINAPGATPITVNLTSIPDQACTTGIRGVLSEDNGYIGTGVVGTVLPTLLTPFAVDTWGNSTNGAIYPPAPNGGAIIRYTDGTFRVQLGPVAGSVQLVYTELFPGGSPLPSGYMNCRTGHSALTAIATAGPADAISVAGGDAQTGVVGTALSAPLSVRVVDQYGNSTTGSVAWTVSSGGGSIAGSGTSATWTLGTAAGLQSATAALSNGASVSFSATAIAGAPASISNAGGEGQTAAAGTALPNPLIARVTDSYGNPVSGAAVTWTVTSGGGSIASSSVTGTDGRATASWTLGTTPGTNTVQATVSGTTISVQFTANGS